MNYAQARAEWWIRTFALAREHASVKDIPPCDQEVIAIELLRLRTQLESLLGGHYTVPADVLSHVREVLDGERMGAFVPDAPECGTFDAPVCLVDLTPDDSPVKRICGRLLPCEEHR